MKWTKTDPKALPKNVLFPAIDKLYPRYEETDWKLKEIEKEESISRL